LSREENGLDASSQGTDELLLDASDCRDAAPKRDFPLDCVREEEWYGTG
jgi:hypothetical protein